MRHIRHILAVLLLALAGTAHASPWALDVNLTSYHTEQWARDALNQSNPGLGLEYQIAPDWSAMTGFYRNSYRRTSAYALAAWTPLHVALPAGIEASAGIAAGLVGGYTREECPVAPLGAAGVLKLRKDGYGINLLMVPNMGSKSGFIGLQAVISF
ncbi:hypothetical protein [Thiomonas sp.]|uniref:hypothetical protein n=1 Tax=Thiomonas sp. TaxID=2047785 RepID=UPI0026369069|nr:hypothetical protein [Thiomonas sp.]